MVYTKNKVPTRLEEIVSSGLRLYSSGEGVCMPEIPYIVDVLFALRLSTEEENYSICMGNHSPYIANVHLVAAAIGVAVMDLRGDDNNEQARKIIAKAIVALTPDDARCFFNTAYMQAFDAAGNKVPDTASSTAALLRAACAVNGCERCKIPVIR